MNRSLLIALGIFAALCLYMLTGLFGCSREEAPVADGEAPARRLMTVKVREMEAEIISREVTFSGKTAPARAVNLKAETEGKVVRIAIQRGQAIRQGEIIVEIELLDRPERLAQAQAALDQAQFEYEATLRLQQQGLRPPAQVSEALARLRGAERLVRSIELDIHHTTLAAPFDGILQERMVETGDFLSVGDPVARVIELDPLVLEGRATEFQVAFLKVGESASGQLSHGGTVKGKIRYVGSEADALSRTFLVEMEAPNPGNLIPAGVSARISVETDRVAAYRISPALIFISDEGTFGVKIVNEANRVEFFEADIVKSDPQVLWLTGLPDRIRLITVGQGFTQPGDEVEVELESGAWN